MGEGAANKNPKNFWQENLFNAMLRVLSCANPRESAGREFAGPALGWKAGITKLGE